jgi:hypothetical protein
VTKEDLAELVAIELLEATIRELIALADDVGDSEPAARDQMAAGAFLAQLYTGMENILKQFCRFQGVALPIGDNWHAALLRRFSEPSDVGLPVFFSAELLSELGAFRKLRHVVYHGDGFQMEWSGPVPGIRRPPAVLREFRSSIESYLAD